MGEEEKKPEEKKPEEKKPEEKKAEEKKAEEKKEGEKEEKKEGKKEGEAKKEEEKAKETVSDEIILKVYMHCEGCARKVRRSLKGFEGVEAVQTDTKTHKVVVKGKKADPLKVCERVQRKSGRKVELISPIPKPEEPKKPDEKEVAKPVEVKKEEPVVILVVLKVHMHCEACAQEIRKRIMKMKGIELADPDLKSQQVIVKGVFDPPKLVEYVYKRTGKHAVIVKQDPAPAKKEENTEKDQKKEEPEKKEPEKKEEKKEEKVVEEETVAEIKKNEVFYPQYTIEYVHAPQIFSDENPNACSIM
ncbi:heavy metal-associated isoprenylated plant protein 7 [Amborella trichopoda]|uniref:HMA domain-containing protein n=1 Tax=Amborella trichopoda TaxID=13333 RepID=W1PQ36_AMBTC|nr:heavy metal-associated isoprenylated plant protein 7 [Amborella trichopoda]ERN09826.1 hypothetical protein AMTR_s00013p00034640 [Amborella trichopoda]|eukprot:XP_006848245.1 heavy metal-associated isoprenylated plant protein 7 [Amborella trichopoda]